MMTQIQPESLLDVRNIAQCQSVLDMGCGTGALTEFFTDHTDGHVTGIDFSFEAIEFAQKRTKNKENRLSFKGMDMDEIAFPSNSFDILISVDTLYFVNDLDKTISVIRDSFQEQGQMGIFFSSTISEGEAREMLCPENTVLSKVLKNTGYNLRLGISLQKKRNCGKRA